jgi:hypothetical protein
MIPSSLSRVAAANVRTFRIGPKAGLWLGIGVLGHGSVPGFLVSPPIEPTIGTDADRPPHLHN